MPDKTSTGMKIPEQVRMFPVELFKSNIGEEILTEHNGISLQELERMLDYKLLYKALHLTLNLHTADWNSCVIRRCVAILEHKALTYEDIYNARVAYQAYEAGDMKGMVLNQHVMMRTLKMCGKTISPMKLMHRIKHSKNLYDEPGRIQLYEFIDLILWADVYETYKPDRTYGHFEMHDKIFKLTDFDKLLSHHDERLANRLNAQYLKDEWEFPNVKIKDTTKKFKDGTVICGDSRVEMTAHQKQSYRHLRSEIVRSQNDVHCVTGGSVRERPITAPNLSMYSERDNDEYKRRQSIRAQSVIYNKIHDLLQHAYNKDKNGRIQPVDMSDRPVLVEHKRGETPQVVTADDVEDTADYLERLLFDIETEGGRYEIARDTEMESYIPKYKENKEEINQQKALKEQQTTKKKSPRLARKQNRYEDAVTSLAYPTPRIPPSHAKRCDARFRGWYGVRSKKGPHYVLMSPYFHDSPKGQLFKKLAKMSDSQVKQIHGEFLYRRTKSANIDQRPVTAPAVMTMGEYKNHMAHKSEPSSRMSKLSRMSSSGYGSMEDTDKEHDSSGHINRLSVEFKHEANEEEENLEVSEKVDTQNSVGRVSVIPEESESAVSETPRSPGRESGVDTYESNDSVETSFSDKMSLLNLERDQQSSVTDHSRRAKSAYVQRSDQLQSNGDVMLRNAEEGRQERSKSAQGDSRMDRPIEDIAPIPYMDHSKPKVVSVGNIGKITLLESITEAKFWENMAMEQQGKKKETKDGKKPDTSGREIPEEHLLSDNVKSKAAAEHNEHHDDDIGNIDDFVEQRISSQSKKKGSSRKTANEEDDDNNSEDDILSLIIQEEKRKRKLQKASKRRPDLNFCSSPTKSWSRSSSCSSNRARLGSSTSQSSRSSGLKDEDGGKLGQDSNRKQTFPLQHHSLLKSPDKANKSGPQKHVVVRTISELKKASIKPPNKYDGLVKRLGEDMTPYLKKQMMKLAVS